MPKKKGTSSESSEQTSMEDIAGSPNDNADGEGIFHIPYFNHVHLIICLYIIFYIFYCFQV